MVVSVLADQEELTYNSSVRTQHIYLDNLQLVMDEERGDQREREGGGVKEIRASSASW